jgi:hypothetical protein
MQFLHSGRNLNPIPFPECKYCLYANLHFLHSGQAAKTASRQGRKICTQEGQPAKFALLGSAEIARHVSAEFARDSINYLINDLFRTYAK